MADRLKVSREKMEGMDQIVQKAMSSKGRKRRVLLHNWKRELM